MGVVKKGSIPWNKGKTGVYSEKTLRKIGDANSGEKNGMFGKTVEDYPNLSQKGEKNWNFGRTGENSPTFGRKHPEEEREKMSLASRGEKNPMFNKKHSEETKKKIGVSSESRVVSADTRKKNRIALIKQIERNYGISYPNYNLEACELFKSFDEKCNTKGRYAVYGGGEYCIEELGYFVDYFNPELKLIMEYDEVSHYDREGKLKSKDVNRQAEIQALYPDFEFRRIKQGEEM